jgi:hypothetical protein
LRVSAIEIPGSPVIIGHGKVVPEATCAVPSGPNSIVCALLKRELLELLDRAVVVRPRDQVVVRSGKG